jgi:hypothetical protein
VETLGIVTGAVSERAVGASRANGAGAATFQRGVAIVAIGKKSAQASAHAQMK